MHVPHSPNSQPCFVPVRREIFAQNFEQRLVRRERNFGLLAIEHESDVRLLFDFLGHNKCAYLVYVPRRWFERTQISPPVNYSYDFD